MFKIFWSCKINHSPFALQLNTKTIVMRYFSPMCKYFRKQPLSLWWITSAFNNLPGKYSAEAVLIMFHILDLIIMCLSSITDPHSSICAVYQELGTARHKFIKLQLIRLSGGRKQHTLPSNLNEWTHLSLMQKSGRLTRAQLHRAEFCLVIWGKYCLLWGMDFTSVMELLSLFEMLEDFTMINQNMDLAHP